MVQLVKPRSTKPFEVETTVTHRAKLGEIFLGAATEEDRVPDAMHTMMVLLLTGEHRLRLDIPKQDFAPVVAWLFEQLPRTVVTFEPRDNASWYEIVATFASETDAVAFKTRWG